MKKNKLKAASYPVPQNEEEANDYIARIGYAQRARQKIEADMNDELAEVKQRYECIAKTHAVMIEDLSQGVRDWASANRDRLTKSNKVKFARLGAGELLWRRRPPKVTIRNAQQVLDALIHMRLVDFWRTKREIDKEAILKNPDAVKDIPGIKVGSEGEDFVIKPFETQLEEVA